MSRINIHHIIFITFLLLSLVSSQELDYGLDFHYKQADFPDRPSYIDLTKDEPITIPNNFSLNFDIKIHKKNRYGIVFSMYFEDSDDHILMIYKPDYNSDSSRFIISQNFENSLTELKYDKKSLDIWSSFQLQLKKNTDSLKVTFKNTSKRAVIKPIKKRTNIKLFFGSSLYRTDPASMAIRNIIIKDENTGGILYNWPIKEYEGNIIKDIVSGNIGYFFNSYLRRGAYYKTQKIFGVKVPDDITLFPPTVNPENGIIYLTSENNIYKILYNGSLLSVVKNIPPGIEHPDWNAHIYDPYNKRLIGVDRSHGQVSFYNQVTNTWSEIDPEKIDGQYHGTNIFIDSSDGSLYHIGGYGYFTVKKELLKYNYQETKWDTVLLKGDNNYYPRSSVLVTPADSAHNYFVFGGYGNKSGQQDKDFKPLNDLWLLNLKQKSITKIDSVPIPENYITGSGFYCKKDSSLYFVCFPIGHPVTDDSRKILHFKYNIIKGTLENLELGNDLNQNLFYLPSKSTGYAIKKIEDKSNNFFEIYRFKVPYRCPEKNISGILNSRLIAILILVGFLLVILFVIRKFINRIPKSKTTINKQKEISLFGNVTINSNDEDLLENVSPQIKEIFIYFLIHTFVNNSRINTVRFTNDFWPELDRSKAKNARSSAINRLRQFLTANDGIELVISNKIWKMEIHETIVFDFRDYQHIKSSFLETDNLDQDKIKSLISIIDKGLPCADLHYEWLDPIKLSIQKEIENICFNLIKNFFDRNSLDTAEKLASILFKWDPVNEKSLSFLLNILKRQNRIGEINSIFNRFSKEYFNLFNTEYPGTIETILNITKK